MRILGIDPGSVYCGYGVIDRHGTRVSIVEYGVINAKKKNQDFPLRLKNIYERLTQVIKRTNPDESAFESMFFSKNAQTLMKLSHARAAAMLATTLREVPIAEYAPREVKKSVTGNGNADKKQVQYMVKNLLRIDDEIALFDSTDALAVAICHAYNRDRAGKSSNWKDFIRNNPERVVSS